MTESAAPELPAPIPDRHDSPFVSIWRAPGATIKQIAASTPMRLYYPLAGIWGASWSLGLAIRQGISAEDLAEADLPPMWQLIAINLIAGAVLGIIALWLFSFLFAWIGRGLGGSARAREVRSVLAWSSVPHIPNVALAVLVLLLGGPPVLTASDPAGLPASEHPLQRIFVLCSNFLCVYGIVIAVAGMKAIFGIDTQRAIAVYLLGWMIVVGVVAISIFSFARFVMA